MSLVAVASMSLVAVASMSVMQYYRPTILNNRPTVTPNSPQNSQMCHVPSALLPYLTMLCSDGSMMPRDGGWDGYM